MFMVVSLGGCAGNGTADRLIFADSESKGRERISRSAVGYASRLSEGPDSKRVPPRLIRLAREVATMLSLEARATRLCDRVTRREWLRVGGLSVLGLSLPQLLASRAGAGPAMGSATFGR